MQPTVSVIMPTYNREEKFLGRAIDSVLSQSYPHIELVVVDDNPQKSERRAAVAALIARYQSAGAAIVYVQNARNLGGSLARNAGIERCTGAYVTFLDDDDMYLPEKIERQLAFMLEHDLDMSFTASKSYGADEKLVHVRDFPFLQSNDQETLLRAHLTHHLTPTNVYMYKKEALLEIGGFQDAKMGQEFFLMLRSIEKGLKIGYLDRADVRQYLHDEGRISQGQNKIAGETALFEFKKTYFDRLPKKDVRYIVFRHFVVMGVAYKRNHQPLKMAWIFFRAIVSAPGVAFREGTGFLKNLAQR